MSIGLESCRRAADAGGGRLILDVDAAGKTVVKTAELKFKDRVVAWKQGDSFWEGTGVHQQENDRFKQEFYNALVKSNGQQIADLALKAARWPDSWKTDGRGVSGAQVKWVLDRAQWYRKSVVAQTERNARAFLRSGGPNGFAATFSIHGANAGLPAADARNRQLIKLFLREVRRDPNYGKGVMGPGDLRGIAQRAIQKFVDQKRDAFREQYPGLANYVQNGATGGLHEDSRRVFDELNARLDPNTANGDPLGQEPPAFRQAARDALDEIRTVKDLIRQMRYEPAGMKALGDQLFSKFDRLMNLEQQLTALAANDLPHSESGVQLYWDVVGEIRHQRDILISKAGFLDDVRANDPLSKKWAAYSDMLWANAVGHVIDQAVAHVQNGAQGTAAVDRLNQVKRDFIEEQTTAYNNASTTERTVIPGTGTKKEEHPVYLGKMRAKDTLTAALKAAQLPQSEIDRLTSKETLSAAIRKTVNETGSWAPISRDVVVTRDGVTRTYRSQILPAAHINGQFRRRHLSNQPLDQGIRPHEPRRGVSSMTKADHYHARNLKVCKINRVMPDGTTKGKLTIIGNGVLDMWDIADPVERARANERGAKEVLEAAIAANDRIRHEALNRAAGGNNAPPVKLTHVSVNLTTPASWRELPGMEKTERLHDYQELTYTREQFRAFQANTSAGQGRTSVEFQVDDDRNQPTLGQDARINVDVDVISFSFGINPLATGKGVPDFVGGWANVYEHNRTQMEKFIGDLGSDRFGALGAEPGGFIGSVYDRLDENDPEQAELRASIREQTNLVREMFTTEAFKRGNGDPAKMGRHILFLQGLAEQALELLNVTDMAATMSKGCKSDKDRGGVTHAEVFHMVITEDMHGQITPDERLQGDDQTNLYDSYLGFGGLQVQSDNAVVPGSKEAGKLDVRIPDPVVRELLSGLGEQADE
jgi:phosphatidylinositol-4,5-bisphosphate 4-phosphatase